MRLCILGLGAIGQVHLLAALAARDAGADIEISVCSGNEQARRGNFAGLKQNNLGIPIPDSMDFGVHGIEVISHWQSVLNRKDVKVVVIATPTSTHPVIACEAVRKGKHVLIEKPIGLDPKDCLGIGLLANKSGPKVLVGQILPWFPEFRIALAECEAGNRGHLRRVKLKRHINTNSQVASAANAHLFGNPVVDLGVHDFHFALALRMIMVRKEMIGAIDQLVINKARVDVKDDFPLRQITQLEFGKSGITVEVDSGAVEEEGLLFRHGYEMTFDDGTLGFARTFMEYGESCSPPTFCHRRGGLLEPLAVINGGPLSPFMNQLTHAVNVFNGKEHPGVSDANLALDALRLCKQVEALMPELAFA